MTDISPELAALLKRRRPLRKAHEAAQKVADELGLAMRAAGEASLARRAELERLETAANRACDAFTELDYAIAAFPSRTIADAAVKARIVATEIEGLSLGPGADGDGDTIDLAFLRGLARDLSRLAAS